MEKNNCLPRVFTDLSTEENMHICGGTTFAYDVARVLRFLGISAAGVHGPAFAISDWVGTSFLMEE